MTKSVVVAIAVIAVFSYALYELALRPWKAERYAKMHLEQAELIKQSLGSSAREKLEAKTRYLDYLLKRVGIHDVEEIEREDAALVSLITELKSSPKTAARRGREKELEPVILSGKLLSREARWGTMFPVTVRARTELPQVYLRQIRASIKSGDSEWESEVIQQELNILLTPGNEWQQSFEIPIDGRAPYGLGLVFVFVYYSEDPEGPTNWIRLGSPAPPNVHIGR